MEAMGLRAVTVREIRYRTIDDQEIVIMDGEYIVVDPVEGVAAFEGDYFLVTKAEYQLVQ